MQNAVPRPVRPGGDGFSGKAEFMIRTAIIGAGGIAVKHAQAINRIPELDVAGVLDRAKAAVGAAADLAEAL